MKIDRYTPAAGLAPLRASRYRQGTSGVRCLWSIHLSISIYIYMVYELYIINVNTHGLSYTHLRRVQFLSVLLDIGGGHPEFDHDRLCSIYSDLNLYHIYIVYYKYIYTYI